MKLLLFLVLSQYELACKYGTIGYRIAFSNTLCYRQGCTRNFIQFTFSMKDVFSLFIFEVDFILKIEDN